VRQFFGDNMADNNNPPDTDTQFRFNLAKWIVVFVFSVTGLIGITAIIAAVSGNGPAHGAVKDILGILLPVLSAWAGTVFAFYFGRENFEAAARSSAALVKQLTPEEKLRSIIVKDVMIPIDKATKLIIDKPETDIKLKADMIDAILEKEKRERLPMLDSLGRIKFMAHRSLIDKFIVEATAATSPPSDPDALTLEDMLNDPAIKAILTGSFRTVVDSTSLAEVKTLMDKIESCSDVFITDDGTPNTKVTGWVTNVIVRQQATL
jgi:hypothetical protein